MFKAPASATTAKPAPVAPGPGTDEEATPYSLKEDAPTPEQIKKSAQGEAVDQMVIDARRTKL
ncbi:MAG TPA: hypothetical protein PKA06_06700, partial [Gemmatales bacterium]|nr:hypothetical protein [Gemmatales bacterium]